MNPLGAAGGRAGPRAGGRPRAREGPLEGRPPPPPRPPPPRPQRVPLWGSRGGLSCDQGLAGPGERSGVPALRDRSSEEGGSPPPEGQSARGAGRRSARPPARRLAASPALALRAPRFAGCSSHPRPPPCSLARSFEPVSKPCGAPGRVRGEGPRGQRRAGGGGPGREQPAGEGPCPARAPRGPSAASDRAAWTAACPPPPPGPARALGPGAWSPGRA